MPIPRILELTTTISQAVAKIQTILDTQGLSSPSFDEDAPTLPTSIADAQDAVLDATAELHDLLTDPLNLLHRARRLISLTSLGDKSACLQVIARFDIARLIPPGGRVSYADVARQTPLTEGMVGRIVRHAATMRVFREPEPGVIAHTRAALMLADPAMRDWLRAGTEEMGPATAKLAHALEKWPASQKPNETGFSLANGTTDSIYDVIVREPERAVRFANAMKVMASKLEFDVSYSIDHYNWAALGEAEVVNVGGAKGHFSFALAERHSKLHITVQDMAFVIADSDVGEMAERVSFIAHSLFDTQTICADVSSFDGCFTIAQVPALRPGARVIIQEAIMSENGSIAYWKMRDFRAMDLEMACTFNARERTLQDWKKLFEEADLAFVLKSVVEPKGSIMGMLEFVWKGAGA